MATANSTEVKNIMIETESFNEATVLMAEVEALIDMLGEVTIDPTSLQKHTLQSSCLLAGRLLAEASDKFMIGARKASPSMP